MRQFDLLLHKNRSRYREACQHGILKVLGPGRGRVSQAVGGGRWLEVVLTGWKLKVDARDDFLPTRLDYRRLGRTDRETPDHTVKMAAY